jgi:putative oxidoreductase
MELGLLVLRLVVGVLFIGHGTQKLFGWYGGHGLAATAGFFDSLGLRPGRFHARAAGFNETVGGLLLLVGLLTPVGAALIIATMVAAIITVHYSKGLWSTEGGYEYNLVLVAASFCLACTGAGTYSLDNLLGLGLHGAGWGVAALIAGLLGGIAAVGAGRAGARAEPGARTRGPVHPTGA